MPSSMYKTNFLETTDYKHEGPKYKKNSDVILHFGAEKVIHHKSFHLYLNRLSYLSTKREAEPRNRHEKIKTIVELTSLTTKGIMSCIVKTNVQTYPKKLITEGISYVSHERAPGAEQLQRSMGSDISQKYSHSN